MSPLPPMIPALSKIDATLHVAVLSNDCMGVVDALSEGANPRAAGATGMSIFDLAVRLGYVDIMAAMLHAGMDVDFQIVAGKSWPPLARAIEEDIAGLTTKRTALLLNYGARLDVTFHYNSKDGCRIDDIFASRQDMAMPPEEVTIGDLRELLAAPPNGRCDASRDAGTQKDFNCPQCRQKVQAMTTDNWWHPQRFARKLPYLQARADIMANIRAFFVARGYLEVQTPALQISPCMEPHIQAFKTELLSADMQHRSPYYLHTSPEFAMKKLLVAGLPKIFQLATVFRNAEGATWHSPEFCLLEWYQTGMDYTDLMQESIDLVRAVTPGVLRGNGRTADPHQEWEIMTVVDAVKKYADIDIADHLNDIDHLRAEATRIGVYVSPDDDWDNALLKIIMDKVENVIGGDRPAIMYDYPVSMAALSRPKPSDPRFAERFEIYACGVELCNAFGELTDARVQRKRFLHDVHLRKKIYGDDYPVDEDFLRALDHGLPQCSGNAMGIDRLIMLVTGADDIDLVQAVPVRY